MCRVSGSQLCLAAGGLQREQDQQGEEETDRLHRGCGTAQGSALLSRELSTPLINLSEDTASGEKSFIFTWAFRRKDTKCLIPLARLRCEDEQGGVTYHQPQMQLHRSPDDLNRCPHAAFRTPNFPVRHGEASKESLKPAL